MSSAPSLPSCPKCGRRIAAWKMDHCVYCGTAFPAGFREGLQEPESLKWIERPGLSPDASKQLELMKVMPLERVKQPRSLVIALAGFAIPVFGVIFYLAFTLLKRYSPVGAIAILLGGVVAIGYSIWKGARTGQD